MRPSVGWEHASETWSFESADAGFRAGLRLQLLFFLWIMNCYENFPKAVNPFPEQSRNSFKRFISEC